MGLTLQRGEGRRGKDIDVGIHLAIVRIEDHPGERKVLRSSSKR